MQQFLQLEGLSGLSVVPRDAAVADDAVTDLFSLQRNALQDLDRFVWACLGMLLGMLLGIFDVFSSCLQLQRAQVQQLQRAWGTSFVGRPGWARECNDKALPLCPEWL